MAKVERTSTRVGKIAARALPKGKATKKEVQSLAGGELTKRPDKKSTKKK